MKRLLLLPILILVLGGCDMFFPEKAIKTVVVKEYSIMLGDVRDVNYRQVNVYEETENLYRIYPETGGSSCFQWVSKDPDISQWEEPGRYHSLWSDGDRVKEGKLCYGK